MRVPAGFVTKGMVTEHNGVVTSIDHTDTDTPVVIEGDHGISLHSNTDMVEVTHGVYRMQYWDWVWGGFRDVENTGSPFTNRKSFADKNIRDLMSRDGDRSRKYRILVADANTIVYRHVGSRIVTGPA